MALWDLRRHPTHLPAAFWTTQSFRESTAQRGERKPKADTTLYLNKTFTFTAGFMSRVYVLNTGNFVSMDFNNNTGNHDIGQRSEMTSLTASVYGLLILSSKTIKIELWTFCKIVVFLLTTDTTDTLRLLFNFPSHLMDKFLFLSVLSAASQLPPQHASYWLLVVYYNKFKIFCFFMSPRLF